MNLAKRTDAVKRVLWVTLALNLLVAAAKAIYGAWSGSLAIASDAVHSLVDAVSNVIGLLVVGAAARPPDSQHPYGHRKHEVVAAALIGVVIGVAALRFGWAAAEALLWGRPAPTTSLAGFVIIIGTWIINVFVAAYEGRKAKQLDSVYLAADAAHTASDVLVTAAVLLAFTAAHFGIGWADPIGAFVVLLMVGRVAWGILAGNVAVLVDAAVVPADEVRRVVMAVPGVRGCHRVRSRGPETAAHLDLHILLYADLSLRQAHELAHRAEDALREAFPALVDVVVHMEPHDDAPEPL